MEKDTRKKVECNSISRVEFTNVLNKDKKSLLVRFLISSRAGSQYNVYTLENNNFKEGKLGIWNKFQVINTPEDNDKDFVFAVWKNDVANVENIEVLRFTNENLYYAEDFYFYYQEVIPYYNKIISENSNNELAWYYLIDAEIRSNEINDAYKCIDSVSKIDKEKKVFPVTNKNGFKFLKAKALIADKNFKQAFKVLDELIKETENDISNLKGEHEDFMAMFEYLTKIYIDQGKVYLAENNKEKAKESFTKALNIFEGLNKKNYYGEGDGIDVHKDIDINYVKNYLEESK